MLSRKYGTLSQRRSARSRFSLPRMRPPQGRQVLAAPPFRRVRSAARLPLTASAITAEISSGRVSTAPIMEPMARPSPRRRRRHHRTYITHIPMTCPGTGRIAIRRMSRRPHGPMCRAARPSPSRFPDATAASTSSTSRAVTEADRRLRAQNKKTARRRPFRSLKTTKTDYRPRSRRSSYPTTWLKVVGRPHRRTSAPSNPHYSIAKVLRS